MPTPIPEHDRVTPDELEDLANAVRYIAPRPHIASVLRAAAATIRALTAERDAMTARYDRALTLGDQAVTIGRQRDEARAELAEAQASGPPDEPPTPPRLYPKGTVTVNGAVVDVADWALHLPKPPDDDADLTRKLDAATELAERLKLPMRLWDAMRRRMTAGHREHAGQDLWGLDLRAEARGEAVDGCNYTAALSDPTPDDLRAAALFAEAWALLGGEAARREREGGGDGR